MSTFAYHDDDVERPIHRSNIAGKPVPSSNVEPLLTGKFAAHSVACCFVVLNAVCCCVLCCRRRFRKMVSADDCSAMIVSFALSCVAACLFVTSQYFFAPSLFLSHAGLLLCEGKGGVDLAWAIDPLGWAIRGVGFVPSRNNQPPLGMSLSTGSPCFTCCQQFTLLESLQSLGRRRQSVYWVSFRRLDYVLSLIHI